MAILSRRRSYLFIQAPRTACTAVADGVLIPHADGERFPGERMAGPRGGVVRAKHVTVAGLLERRLISRTELDSLLVFSTVRNPWDLQVSRYVKMRTDWSDRPQDPARFRDPIATRVRAALDLPFPAWVEEVLVRPSLRRRVAGWVRGRRPDPDAHLRGADVMLRFERLQQDLDRVLERVGVEPVPIPWINVTPGRDPDYRTYYDRRSRDLVARAYRERIERFGYRF
jgi:hypothetical protein